MYDDLKPFATERQWEILQTVARCGSLRAAAKELGIQYNAVVSARDRAMQKAARQGYSPAHDMTRTVPDGFYVRGVSTYYGKDGEPRGQWVKSQIDHERQEEMLREWAAAMGSTLPRVKPLAMPKDGAEHLMACYPIGDHHLGMLAWAEEAGENYDLSIGETLLMAAMDHLVAAVPPCRESAVVFLGDFMHYDSFDAVTPTSRNLLDSDSRYPKMVRAAIRTMRYVIEAARRRHGRVKVIVEIGNHDLSSSIFLMECLANVYENEPRVMVDTSPRHFHYFDFGKNLVGVHHGHGVKMDKLPLIMAADHPELWGRTEHRYWWTGHVHHDQVKDFEGCRVESFRVLAPQDAYASNRGFRPCRDMKAILLHKEYGEVARHIVNPSMLEVSA